MILGILGKKISMSQIFDYKGNNVPVTLINAEPSFICQIKSKSNLGYNSAQLAYSEIRLDSNKIKKPMIGHFIKKNMKCYRYIKEFRFKNDAELKIGQKISLNLFKTGDLLNISGLTSGKGNASNIKRNNFTRGPMSHGSKHHRLQGSLGAGTSPGRVFPGKKMPGRAGTKNCTIKNLEILLIDSINNIIIVRGSIPGKQGNLVKLVSVNNINKN